MTPADMVILSILGLLVAAAFLRMRKNQKKGSPCSGCNGCIHSQECGRVCQGNPSLDKNP